MNGIAIYQPQKEDIFKMVDNADLADTTKVKYKRALANYLETGNSLTDVDALSDYAKGIGKSSRAFLKAAIKLWGEDILATAKGNATPDNVDAITATVYRLEALNDSIKVKASKGSKTHFWLNQKQVKALFDTIERDTLKGERDAVVIALLVGAGLRRNELANLTFDDIQLVPKSGKFRTVIDVTGKGDKSRSIPISDKLAAILDSWQARVNGGLIARSVSKGGKLGESISTIGIFHIVRNAGIAIGKPELAPHDLRRTYAQLGYEAGVPITQISKLLGHSNIATTQRYLNLELDYDCTISDFVPIG